MKALRWVAAVLAAVCGAGGAWANDPISVDGVKCVVKPTVAARRDVALDYRGGRIYFCCDGCRRAFESESGKFAAQANLQLVQTKQAQQARCPMSGQECRADSKASFQGAEIAFCCDGCKSLFEEATTEEKLKLAFADKAFDKAFRMVNGISSNASSESKAFVHLTVPENSSNVTQQQVRESTTRSRPLARTRLFRRR